VSDTDIIAGALCDLAEQAVTVPPAADALWRAGQRRRRRNVLAISATAPGAAAVAVVLAFTLGGGPSAAGHGGSVGGATGTTGSLVLSTPIQFKQVAQAGRTPCPATVNPTTGRVNGGPECIRFTGTGMAITRLQSARVQRGPGGHQYQIDIRMTPADARRFATLTRELAGQHSPRNRLAIVTNGYVLADPVVMAAITAGQAAIPGFATRPQAEFFLATLTGG
jgi:SecD-like export protein